MEKSRSVLRKRRRLKPLFPSSSSDDNGAIPTALQATTATTKGCVYRSIAPFRLARVSCETALPRILLFSFTYLLVVMADPSLYSYPSPLQGYENLPALPEYVEKTSL